MKIDLTQMKRRLLLAWRRISTSSETCGPRVCVWGGGGGIAHPILAQLQPLQGSPGRAASRSWEPCRPEPPPPPPPPEMKMYSLAVTPNGHLEGRGSLPPPLIMRTAATPMPTPKSSPHLDVAHGLLDSRRGSSCSMDPQLGDQKSLVGTVPCPRLHLPNSLQLPARTSEGPARPCHTP